MEAFDVAIKMEQDGYRFYSEEAGKLKDQAAARMLRSLAEDEKRHEEIIRGLKAGRTYYVASATFAGIRNIFEDLRDRRQSFFNENDSLAQVLAKGAEMETRSVSLYRAQAQQARTEAEKNVWRALQAEEEKHEKLLKMTLEFIEEPALILENSEFLFYGNDKT